MCNFSVGRITVALSVMLANKQWEGAKLFLAYSDVLRGLPVRLMIPSFLGTEFLKPHEDVHVSVFRCLFPCE